MIRLQQIKLKIPHTDRQLKEKLTYLLLKLPVCMRDF